MLISAPCARILSVRLTSSLDEPPRKTPFVLTKNSPLLVLAFKRHRLIVEPNDLPATRLAIAANEAQAEALWKTVATVSRFYDAR